METEYGSFGDQIKKVLELTEDNNRMLKAIRRDKWIGMIVNFVFWTVIFIASTALTMQYLGPIMQQFTGGEAGSPDFMKVLQQYQAEAGK